MCSAKRTVSKGLLDNLREAFPESNPPSESEIAEVLHPSEEWVRTALAGVKWSDLPGSDVGPLACELSLLTLKTFHYYLPALVLHAYQSCDEQFVWWVLPSSPILFMASNC